VLNRSDKKRLLIYAGIALIASGIILMILLYSLVYWHSIEILHWDNKTRMVQDAYTLQNTSNVEIVRAVNSDPSSASTKPCYDEIKITMICRNDNHH